MRIAVLGAGAWGSALAMSLSSHHDVSLWTRDALACDVLARDRTSRYLPDAALPAAVRVTSDLAGAVG